MAIHIAQHVRRLLTGSLGGPGLIAAATTIAVATGPQVLDAGATNGPGSTSPRGSRPRSRAATP